MGSFWAARCQVAFLATDERKEPQTNIGCWNVAKADELGVFHIVLLQLGYFLYCIIQYCVSHSISMLCYCGRSGVGYFERTSVPLENKEATVSVPL